jgi:hypothetical protein
MATITGTSTFARFSLLKLQVLNLLSEAAYVTENYREKVAVGLEKHYIEEVSVLGLYSNGDIGAVLCIKIDWREHELLIKAGGENVQIPPNWEKNVAPSLSEAIKIFNEACNIASLSREWTVNYGNVSETQRTAINEELTLTPSLARKWRNPPNQADLVFGPLSEASGTLSIGID